MTLATRWMVEEGEVKRVRVAPWVIEKEKEALYRSLINFLIMKDNALRQTKLWLDRVWGKMPIRVQLLEEGVVWIQLCSKQEADTVWHKVKAGVDASPFVSLDRWTQFMGYPQREL